MTTWLFLLSLVLVAFARVSEAGFIEWESVSVAKDAKNADTYLTSWTGCGLHFSRALMNDERLGKFKADIIVKKLEVDFPCRLYVFEYNQQRYQAVNSSCSSADDASFLAKANSSEDGKLRYWDVTKDAPLKDVSFAESGGKMPDRQLYYVWITTVAPDAKAKVTAVFELSSTFGYLPGSQYAFLHVFGALCLFFLLVLLPFWTYLCIKFKAELLQIQLWIGGIIIFCIIEFFVNWLEMIIYNVAGLNYFSAMVAGTIFVSIQSTLSRMLVLVVCLGYGVATPALGEVTKARIGVLSLVYLVMVAIKNLIFLQAPRDGSADADADLLILVPYAVLEAVWYYWIFESLIKTIARLRSRRQVLKLEMYLSFLRLMIALLVGALIIFLVSLAARFFEGQASWETQTGCEVAFTFLRVSVLMFVIWLWRPQENNTRFAYNPVDDGSSDEEIVLTDLGFNQRVKEGDGAASPHVAFVVESDNSDDPTAKLE